MNLVLKSLDSCHAQWQPQILFMDSQPIMVLIQITNYKEYKQQRSLFKIQQLSFGVGVSSHQGRSIIDTGLQKINDQIYIFWTKSLEAK